MQCRLLLNGMFTIWIQQKNQFAVFKINVSFGCRILSHVQCQCGAVLVCIFYKRWVGNKEQASARIMREAWNLCSLTSKSIEEVNIYEIVHQ